MEGQETVSLRQQRLFLNFDKRLEGRTQAIENWIELVEIAQKQRQEELRQLATQPDLFQFSFTQEKRTKGQSYPQEDRQTEMERNNSTPQTNNNWAQQDLRQLFLRPNPNVRMRH